MQSFIFQDINKDWVNDQVLHNRLNLFWYPSDNFTGTIQLRNRIFTGDNVRFTPGYKRSFNVDDGIIDMNENIAEGNSYLMNSAVDRLWLRYSLNRFEATVGRQRINWGQTFVWNPNDIFNAYSFFDFDYPERPGSDAVRLQYYTGMTSSVEAAVKADSRDRITVAGKVRFNRWNYDFQVLGGIVNEEDYVLGAGWSGYIKNASFRGEMSYFHPKNHFEDTAGVLSLSLGGDYTFRNSLFLQVEALYMQLPEGYSFNSFNDLYDMSLSAKLLSFTEYNFFAQVSYPLNPLLNGALATIYYPGFNGFFIGPSLDLSVTDNMSFSAYLQLFNGEFEMQQGGFTVTDRLSFNLVFVRLKWNF
jgi:hypothetical protein